MALSKIPDSSSVCVTTYRAIYTSVVRCYYNFYIGLRAKILDSPVKYWTSGNPNTRTHTYQSPVSVCSVYFSTVTIVIYTIVYNYFYCRVLLKCFDICMLTYTCIMHAMKRSSGKVKTCLQRYKGSF